MDDTKKAMAYRCKSILQEQLYRIEEMMRLAQEEANKETKSSAGDKYETGRSMMQLEKEKYSIQHARVSHQLAMCNRLDLNIHSEVREGSLVYTDVGIFFVAVGVGSLSWKEKRVECISLSTPIGSALEGAEAGDVVEFREQEIEILDVQ